VNKIAETSWPRSCASKLARDTRLVRFCRRLQSAIRKAAIKYKVPYITTLVGAYNTVKGIVAAKNGHGAVKSLQEYHATIEEV